MTIEFIMHPETVEAHAVWPDLCAASVSFLPVPLSCILCIVFDSGLIASLHEEALLSERLQALFIIESVLAKFSHYVPHRARPVTLHRLAQVSAFDFDKLGLGGVIARYDQCIDERVVLEAEEAPFGQKHAHVAL